MRIYDERDGEMMLRESLTMSTESTMIECLSVLDPFQTRFVPATCPAMEHILGDSTGENAEPCGATVEAGEMFCSQHKEEN